MRRTDRLFELIQKFRGGRLRRGKDLAEELGVSLRTLYRDIDTLTASGIPIEGERGVGYLLRDPIFLPPLNLTATEFEALQFGLTLGSKAADAELADASNLLLEKISAVLPDSLKSRTAAPAIAAYNPHIGTSLNTLPDLRQAIGKGQKLDIVYENLQGATSQRTIWPLQVEYWGHVWTCTSWCELRDDFRVFRVDRIQQVKRTTIRFPGNAKLLLAQYLRRFEEAPPGRGNKSRLD